MKRIFGIVTIVLCLFMIVGCDALGLGNGGTGDLEETELPGALGSGLAESLVDIPDTLSTEAVPSGSVSRATDPTDDDVLTHLSYLYAPVQNEFNLMADEVLAFIREILNAVETNILSNADYLLYLAENETWDNSDGLAEGDELITITWDTDAAEGEPEFIITTSLDSLPVMRIEFNLTGEDYDGSVWVADVDESGETPVHTGIYYRADFDTNDAELGAVTELYATGLENDSEAGTENVMDRLWLKVWVTDGVYHVDANVHYTLADLGEDFVKPYVMNVLKGEDPFWEETDDIGGNYVFSCSATTTPADGDIGAVSLALVPEVVASGDLADLYLDYSIGAMYEQAFADWFRDTEGEYDDTGATLWSLMETSGFFDNASYNSQSSLTTTLSDLSNTEVFQYFEDFRSYLVNVLEVEDVAYFDYILFVVPGMINPGYFTADGFVGTAGANTPDWADELAVDDDSTLPWTPATIQGTDFTALFDEVAVSE